MHNLVQIICTLWGNFANVKYHGSAVTFNGSAFHPEFTLHVDEQIFSYIYVNTRKQTEQLSFSKLSGSDGTMHRIQCDVGLYKASEGVCCYCRLLRSQVQRMERNYNRTFKWQLKADSHITCRAAKGLECVFPI